MILLTDEEIQRTTYFSVSTEIYDRKEVELGREFFIKGALFGSKAQLKKVVEWGTDICGDHPRRYTVPRFECPECMQALLKEVE